MKHRVSELEGGLLDALVASAEGMAARVNENGDCVLTVGFPEGEVEFEPSTNWTEGGPIIERKRISIVAPGGQLKEWQAHAKYTMPSPPERLATQYGPMPLVAAMRAYVASKFGEEVELP